MTKVKTLIGIVLISVAALSLSGCGLIPLPDDQRYQYINQTKDEIDFSSAGEIIEERYDDGDGVSSPSFFEARVRNTESFEKLSEGTQLLKGADCNTASEEQTTCNIGQITVTIKKSAINPDDTTSIRISDRYSGRKPE